MFLLNLILLFSLVKEPVQAQPKMILPSDAQCALLLEEAFYVKGTLTQPSESFKNKVSERVSRTKGYLLSRTSDFNVIFSFVPAENSGATRVQISSLEGEPVYVDLQKGTPTENYSNLKGIENYLLQGNSPKGEGMMSFSRKTFRKLIVKVYKRAQEEDVGDKIWLGEVVKLDELPKSLKIKALSLASRGVIGIGTLALGFGAAYLLPNDLLGVMAIVTSVCSAPTFANIGQALVNHKFSNPILKLDPLCSALDLLKLYAQDKVESGFITVPWNSKQLTLFLEKDRVDLLIWSYSLKKESPFPYGVVPPGF